jgi:hypothetical protein
MMCPIRGHGEALAPPGIFRCSRRQTASVLPPPVSELRDWMHSSNVRPRSSQRRIGALSKRLPVLVLDRCKSRETGWCRSPHVHQGSLMGCR